MIGIYAPFINENLLKMHKIGTHMLLCYCYFVDSIIK